jgi:hypothetical protein
MNQSRVVLLRREDPFWQVDATIENGRLSICSGDSRREWYVLVERSERPRLLQALRSRCGARGAPDAPPDGETLALLAQAFSDRSGLLEEIQAFLDRAAIPYRTTSW